jgi:hypothetical protein
MASILGMKQAQVYKPTRVAASGTQAKTHPLYEGANIEMIDERWTLVVTDGRIALRVPINREHGKEEITGGYLSSHALRLIERNAFRLTEQLVLIGRSRPRVVDNKHVDGEPLVRLARIEPDKSVGDEPGFPTVADRWPGKSKRPLRISFDPKLLSKLAAGLGADALTLEVDLDQTKEVEDGVVYERPMVAWHYGHERPEHGAQGLVMPMREPIEPKKPAGEKEES